MKAALPAKLAVLGWLLSTPNPTAAAATVAGELQHLRIESSLFTTCVRGIERRVQITDPTQSRFLVLNLSADFPRTTTRIHAPDFVLAYARGDGRDDRAKCTAMGIGSAEDPDPTIMGVGEYVSVPVGPGTKRLAVAFSVECDVQRVALYVAGCATPIEHELGEARPYSVFITTNLKGANAVLDRVRKQVEDTGMRVTACGNGLTANESENTILYQAGLESVARELSQRLMLECGVVAKLKLMDVTTCNDFVVWLGDKRLASRTRASVTRPASPARLLAAAGWPSGLVCAE